MATPQILRFGKFELDVRSRELRCIEQRRPDVPGDIGSCVRLQEQPLEILRLMLERPGDVITRDELRQRLWPQGTFVDFEHSLNAAIKRLRAALGDDADHPRFIETVPRRGYRFIGDVPGAIAKTSTGPSSPRLRLVVLPFSNLSDDSSQEYFSDGLTEELIAQLGPLCRGQVGIIGRWSSMFFKGSLQRAREIGEALNAEYLLEGSTRRDGSRVRITARLVEAATETQLWSETYERSTADWLSVQADVAGRVARSLLRELVPPARAELAPGDHPRAYQAYLKGKYHWARPGDVGLDEALRWFTEAVTEAPEFAAALAALGRVQVASAEYYHELPRAALAAARESATRALLIDPTVSEAHAVTGDLQRMLDGDWGAAEASYAEAIKLNPSNGAALRSYGLMLALESRYAEALACVERARELDPLCLGTSTTGTWTRYVSGDYDSAIAFCRHMLEMDPEFVSAHRVLAASLLQAGRGEEAVAQLDLALTFDPSHPVLLSWLAHVKAVLGCRSQAQALITQARSLERIRYVPPFHLALAYTGLADFDDAFAALDQAWLDRDPALATLDAEPRFEPIRSDPRYRALVERIKIPRSRVGV
jgi:TolB-like protein/tetratricopeptide (TPR) repeat protein